MAQIKREGADTFTPKLGLDKPLTDKDCPYCQNKFDDKEALQRHIDRKHSEPDEGLEDELAQGEFDDEFSEE